MRSTNIQERARLLSKISMALEILSDGRWHATEELLLRLDLSQHKFRELALFLTTYSLVKIDEKKGRLRINSGFKNLLT